MPFADSHFVSSGY